MWICVYVLAHMRHLIRKWNGMKWKCFLCIFRSLTVKWQWHKSGLARNLCVQNLNSAVKSKHFTDFTEKYSYKYYFYRSTKFRARFRFLSINYLTLHDPVHKVMRLFFTTGSVRHHSECDFDALPLPVSLTHSWSNSTLQPSSKWSAQIATVPLPSFCINLRSSDALQRYNSHILSHTGWLHLQGQCTHTCAYRQAKI